MSRKSKSLFLLVLICTLISLISALAPLSDFDLDGNLDSLITEGMLLIPLIGSVTGLFLLWIRFPVACLAVSQQFPALPVPPPIHN